MVLIVFLAYFLTQQSGGAAQAVPVLGAMALGAQRVLPHMQNIYNALASMQGTTLALLMPWLCCNCR